MADQKQAVTFGERLKLAAERVGEPRPQSPRRDVYEAYMSSDAWRRRRAEKLLLNVMDYGVLTCEVCWRLIDVQRGHVAVVHHLTYARFGYEHPQDLSVVHGGDCHNEADRQRALRDRLHIKVVPQTPRVHPDQLALFDHYTPVKIEDMAVNAPPPA